MSSYADIKIILKMGGETIEFDNNRLTAFQIVKTFNDHFKISFKGEVTANQDKYYEMAVYEVHVEVYFNPANTLIFNGVLTRITVHPNPEERTVQVEIEGASYTHYLDVNLFNRAFQDQAMTYQTLVDTITKTYYKALGEELANADKPIETFTLQYQETDWQFLKRMASRLHIGLVPEVTRENIKFYFGMPELKERGVLKEIAPFYGIRKRLRDYRELIASGISDVVEDDFLSFDFKTDELFNIGDYVYLDSDNKNAKLYVYQATMTLEGSLFRCYCAVSPLYGLKQKKTYNPRITGLSLEGKIVAVGGADSSKDYVKVLLPMGVSTDKEKACWFRYATPYTAAGNTGWYWMPEVNDSVLLYFPTCKEEEAMVTTSVRRQESESERLQDPNAAYLRTGFEKELLFKEGQITLTGKDQGLHIYLDQKQGITIESPSELGLQADNNLMLQAGRNLVISAQGDQSAIQLKHKDGKGNNLILNADGGIGFKGKVEKESGKLSRDDGCDIEPTDTNIDKNDEFKYDMDLRKLNNKQRDKRKKELDKELLVQLERGAHAKTNDEKEDAINKVNKILVEYDELKKIANDKTFIRSQIAEAAKSLAGSLYVSGGSEMGGVDCRGTVFYSYKTAGVDLPNSTAQGYHDMMTPIDKSELKPGDIITYLSPTPNRNGDYITHVQVYIGEAIDKWGNLVYDGVINASPNNGLYIVSLEKYNSWSDVIETPNYGTLLDKY